MSEQKSLVVFMWVGGCGFDIFINLSLVSIKLFNFHFCGSFVYFPLSPKSLCAQYILPANIRCSLYLFFFSKLE